MREAISPEVVSRVFDELNEGDEQSPWVRPVHNQPLQEHARDLFLDDLQSLTSLHPCKSQLRPSQGNLGHSVGNSQVFQNNLRVENQPETRKAAGRLAV